MRNLKIVIIILSILLVIICTVLGIILHKKNDTNTNQNKDEENISEANNYIDSEILSDSGEPSGEEAIGDINIILNHNFEEVKYNAEYYSVVDILNKFNNNIKDFLLTGNSTSVMEMLSNKYITEFNINENNLKEKVEGLANNEYQITKMYNSVIENNLQIFIVFGKMANKEYSYMVTIDINNNTFAISLNDYINKYNINMENIKDINVQENTIEKNENNTYSMSDISLEEMAKRYYKNCIEKLKTDSLEAYNLLDNDYKNKVFTNYNNFDSYLKQHISTLENVQLKEYKVENFDNYTQYICKDNFNNYYIFKVEAVMNYKFFFVNDEINYEY